MASGSSPSKLSAASITKTPGTLVAWAAKRRPETAASTARATALAEVKVAAQQSTWTRWAMMLSAPSLW